MRPWFCSQSFILPCRPSFLDSQPFSFCLGVNSSLQTLTVSRAAPRGVSFNISSSGKTLMREPAPAWEALHHEWRTFQNGFILESPYKGEPSPTLEAVWNSSLPGTAKSRHVIIIILEANHSLKKIQSCSLAKN